jgi:hypothetical protein
VLLHDRPRERTRRRRASAALTALVFAFASLLGVVHEATTAHVRCAAHGELVDSAAPAGTTATGPVATTIEAAQPSARGHGDDHCLLASALRESRIAPRPPAIALPVVAISRIAIAASDRGAAPLASVYRIAPKTSPPA